AAALFDWDTASMGREDVVGKLMAVADPTGEGEAAGLASDIGNYLPDQATWASLRRHGTRQWLEVETVAVPETWAETVKADKAGQLLPGTLAHTIAGTRRRAGVWEGEPAAHAEPVVFTVFTACAPSFPECRLLRLSLPGQALR
ncbi:MAG: hypothetical protein LBO20_01535, partial [Bifidobacteriaceae bacterium]|nr:hypothetical protein [Bifidobacteriaceae bacterium]